MRFYVEPSPRGGYRVMLEGSDAPVSQHDTEEEAIERMRSYAFGVDAAAAPTAETGIARGERVTLRDGRAAIVRPVEPEDKPLFVRAFERLGPQSRYQRFLAVKNRLSTDELAYFTEIDHADHEAIFALDPKTGEGIGVARYVRLAEPTQAEAAVVVADDWQGVGLGGALLTRLAVRAQAAGITAFTATMLTSNRSMFTLFGRVGDVRVREVEGEVSELEVVIELEREPGLRDALRAVAEYPLQALKRLS